MNTSISLPIENQTNRIKLAYLKNEPDDVYFYFLGVPTTDLFYILPKQLKFTKISLMASHLHHYIYDDDIKTNTVDDCYNYFITNTDYTIDNLDAELENRIYIGSHDNREIHIKFPKNVDYSYTIHRLLKKYAYEPPKVVELLINNENKYLEIETPNNLINSYLHFNDYQNKTIT